MQNTKIKTLEEIQNSVSECVNQNLGCESFVTDLYQYLFGEKIVKLPDGKYEMPKEDSSGCDEND